MYLGFDPGGSRAFGCALLDGVSVRTVTVSGVDEAIAWAKAACDRRQPTAADIDTLLHWATTAGGLRPCDRWLREAYPGMRNSVMSPNSLFGAMAIGGMALALRLRETWPMLKLNETHPKVLLHARGGQRYATDTVGTAIRWFGAHAGLRLDQVAGEHELDAALSAWATEAGERERWPDIARGEQLLFPAGQASYLWPNTP